MYDQKSSRENESFAELFTTKHLSLNFSFIRPKKRYFKKQEVYYQWIKSLTKSLSVMCQTESNPPERLAEFVSSQREKLFLDSKFMKELLPEIQGMVDEFNAGQTTLL